MSTDRNMRLVLTIRYEDWWTWSWWLGTGIVLGQWLDRPSFRE